MTSAETAIVAAVAVATPTITSLIGIILQRADARDLRAEMRDFRKEIHTDLLLIHERVAVVETKQS